MAIYRVPIDLTYPNPGSPGVNVWHVRTPDPLGTAALQASIANLQEFYTALAPLYPSSTTVAYSGVATDVADGDQVESAGWTLSGSGGSGYAPLATAICVSWRTGTSRRSGIGRTFLGPLQSGLIDADGTIVSTRLSLLRTTITNLILAERSDFPEQDSGLGVYSRASGEWRPFQLGRVRDTFAVLRSRRD